MTTTYDVTAVSHDGQYVPLIASADYSAAHEVACPRSADEEWARVEIREAQTRRVIFTYVDGAEKDGRPR